MAYVLREAPIVQDLPIFYNLNGAVYRYSCQLSASDIQADATGLKFVQAGMFVCKQGNTERFLPRANVTGAFSTGSPTGTLGATWEVFKPADQLFLNEPFGFITLGGTYLATEIVKTTIGGYVLDTVTGSTINTAIAVTVAASINANPAQSSLVRAVASGVLVFFYGKDGITPHTTTTAARNAADSAGSVAGTSTANAATLVVSNTAVGTILSISNTGVVTLTGNAGLAVPVGGKVGIRFVEVLGLYGHSVDFSTKPSIDVAPCDGVDSGVYETNLPYIDEDLKRRFPRLRIRTIFA